MVLAGDRTQPISNATGISMQPSVIVPTAQPTRTHPRPPLRQYSPIVFALLRSHAGLARVVLCFAVLLLATAAVRADTLDAVRERGKLLCGAGEDAPGYTSRDAKGAWSGFGIDVCKALAVAVLGKVDAITIVPLKRAERREALQSGAADVIVGDDAMTASALFEQGLHTPLVLAYEGQSFLVRRAQGISSALELSGTRVCVVAGTGDEEGALDYFAALKIPIQIVKLDRWSEAVQAYEQKTCHALSGHRTRLAAARARLQAPNDHLMLPEVAQRLGLGPIVRTGETRWAQVVRWTGYALIAAETLGVTSANAEQLQAAPNPEVRRLLGGEHVAKGLGLDPGWSRRVIRLVGNYGEIFERNIGARSPLRLERQLNNLAGKGGLHIAPSFR
jgi:general L-amino acid transport system substrate-binding protein